MPKIGKNPDLARDAFKTLTKEKPTVDAPYKTEGRYFFVRLANRTEASEDDVKEAAANLNTEVRASKVSQLLGPYAAVLTFPMDDYGPFLEGMLGDAISSGAVKLYERNYEAIPLVKEGKEENKPINLAKPKATEEKKS